MRRIIAFIVLMVLAPGVACTAGTNEVTATVSPSPDGDWLAFIWSASELSGQQQNGVWLLRLEALE